MKPLKEETFTSFKTEIYSYWHQTLQTYFNSLSFGANKEQKRIGIIL